MLSIVSGAMIITMGTDINGALEKLLLHLFLYYKYVLGLYYNLYINFLLCVIILLEYV